MQHFQHSFEEMDRRSLRGEAFFFVIDFEKENVLVYSPKEVLENEVMMSFPTYQIENPCSWDARPFQWESFPMTIEDYEKGFKIVMENLKKGNSYLTNFTCKSPIKTDLTLEEIYYLSEAKYKVKFQEKWVFFSPETFIEIKENRIFTHPMKGTIDASIPNAAEILKADEKEKAEHYTVVDLLRNDLSMVANEVKVEEFQRIDFLKTHRKNLYAMSSEISGNIKPEFQKKMGSLLKKLLPAGSILGAPKTKTMEITKKAENYERGFYTGVCGWFDGENLDSCVMIRFIEKENEQMFFKSGGGITHKSILEDEYQEMKNKIYVPIH